VIHPVQVLINAAKIKESQLVGCLVATGRVENASLLRSNIEIGSASDHYWFS
jgi:hypothetical protein